MGALAAVATLIKTANLLLVPSPTETAEDFARSAFPTFLFCVFLFLIFLT
jgi:hypothetical protein